MTHVPTIIMRPIFPLLCSDFNAGHIFSSSARHKFLIFTTWKLPEGAGKHLQGGIYHGKMMESTMIRKDLEKKAMLSGITFLVKKNRCKPLIPQPFDSPLWKLHFKIFKTHQNHQKDFLIDWCAERPTTRRLCSIPLPLTLPSISKCWCFRSCCKHPS